MYIKHLTLPLLAFGLLLNGCSKDETVSEQDRETFEAAAEDYLLAESIFENVFKVVDAEAKQQADLNGFQAPENEVEIRNECPGSSLALSGSGLFPATLTLDFGAGCSPDDGPVLSGQVTAIFDGLLLRAGTSYELSFSNFVYGGHAVEGSYRISNDGEDDAGQWTFTAVVDGTITTVDGRTIEFQSTTLRQQTEGYDTNFFTNGLQGIFDDVWSTTRTASLQTSDGVQLAVTTPSPIRNPLLCRWPVSGYYELELGALNQTGTIDFGDGTCDNEAMLTIGDYSRELEF